MHLLQAWSLTGVDSRVNGPQLRLLSIPQSFPAASFDALPIPSAPPTKHVASISTVLPFQSITQMEPHSTWAAMSGSLHLVCSPHLASLCTHVLLFTTSALDGSEGCFQFLVVVNKAAGNTLIVIPGLYIDTCFCFSWKIPKRQIARASKC